jgi:hypothetical protein
MEPGHQPIRRHSASSSCPKVVRGLVIVVKVGLVAQPTVREQLASPMSTVRVRG